MKFYALIMSSSAELGLLVHKNHGLFLAEQQHAQTFDNPMLALSLYVERSEVTRRMVSQYNQCLRAGPIRSQLPGSVGTPSRALVGIVNEIGAFLVTLRSENKLAVARAFSQSAFRTANWPPG